MLLNLLLLFIGIIVGLIFSYIKNIRSKIYGVIEVDVRSNLCKFHITTTDLSSLKTKKAVFIVEHGVDLSRDEQPL